MKNPLPKIIEKFIKQETPNSLDDCNSYPEILSLPYAIEISRQYLRLRRGTENNRWVPL